jgi:hypothetical protein
LFSHSHQKHQRTIGGTPEQQQLCVPAFGAFAMVGAELSVVNLDNGTWEIDGEVGNLQVVAFPSMSAEPQIDTSAPAFNSSLPHQDQRRHRESAFQMFNPGVQQPMYHKLRHKSVVSMMNGSRNSLSTNTPAHRSSSLMHLSSMNGDMKGENVNISEDQGQSEQQASHPKRDVEGMGMNDAVLVFSKWDPDTSESALLTFSGVMRQAPVALSWTSADELVTSQNESSKEKPEAEKCGVQGNVHGGSGAQPQDVVDEILDMFLMDNDDTSGSEEDDNAIPVADVDLPTVAQGKHMG